MAVPKDFILRLICLRLFSESICSWLQALLCPCKPHSCPPFFCLCGALEPGRTSAGSRFTQVWSTPKLCRWLQARSVGCKELYYSLNTHLAPSLRAYLGARSEMSTDLHLRAEKSCSPWSLLVFQGDLQQQQPIVVFLLWKEKRKKDSNDFHPSYIIKWKGEKKGRSKNILSLHVTSEFSLNFIKMFAWLVTAIPWTNASSLTHKLLRQNSQGKQWAKC